MSTPKDTTLGSLSVSVESDSVYFGYSAPIEIRDASMHLVRREQGRSFKLAEGLYQVSAVLEDGQEHTRLIQVRGGESTEVTLGVRVTAPPARAVATTAESLALAAATPSVAQLSRSRFTQKVDAPDDDTSSTDGAPATALLGMKGVTVVRRTRTLVIFECVGHLDAVATATLRIGGGRTEISLPTSPPEGAPTLCAVRFDEWPNGVHATAWISPERTVANALQNMLASGNLSSAASMADEATELLGAKYADPTGAALGALILRKVGRLARLEGWMENLARDFAWLPDGKILLAELLVERRADVDRALALALEASGQRMLYTESYSILLDLLRRWPRQADRGTCANAIGELSAHSPYTDWNSTCLSRSVED